MNIIPKKAPKQPPGLLDMQAPDYYPAMRELNEDVAALDARIAANRTRMAEIDKALNHGAAMAENNAPKPVLDVVRRLLRPGEADDTGPMRQTAAEAMTEQRKEFARLQQEIELLQRGRVELNERLNVERKAATTRRFEEADVRAMRAELQAAARVLYEVHQRGLQMAGELQALGFNAGAPQYFSGMHLLDEADFLVGMVAEGREAVMPEPLPPYRGPLIEKIVPRRYLRAFSNY